MFSGSFLEVSNSTLFLKKHLLKCEAGWDYILYCCQVGKQGSLPHSHVLGSKKAQNPTLRHNASEEQYGPYKKILKYESFISYIAL